MLLIQRQILSPTSSSNLSSTNEKATDNTPTSSAIFTKRQATASGSLPSTTRKSSITGRNDSQSTPDQKKGLSKKRNTKTITVMRMLCFPKTTLDCLKVSGNTLTVLLSTKRKDTTSIHCTRKHLSSPLRALETPSSHSRLLALSDVKHSNLLFRAIETKEPRLISPVWAELRELLAPSTVRMASNMHSCRHTATSRLHRAICPLFL